MTIFKYEEIVDFFVDAIKKGTIGSGEKLSSLRKTANYFDCSLSVVMQAYEELQYKGFISSVEKSGFFVNFKEIDSHPEPQNYNHNLIPRMSQSCSLIEQIVEMAHRDDVLPFGCAIPNIALLAEKKISALLVKTIKSQSGHLSKYSEQDGENELRSEIAKQMLKRGVTVVDEEIIITNGCTEAMYLSIECSTNMGDIIAIETPTYFGLIKILETLDREIIEVPTSPEKGMDLDILEELLSKEEIKAIIVAPIFQNPLSYTMSDPDKKRLYDLSEQFDTLIIEDDIYSECAYDGKISKPLKSFDKSDRVIYCSSFSKTLAPGLRIGWTIAGRYKDIISRTKQISTMGGIQFVEKAIAQYLNSGAYDYHMKYFRKKIAAQVYEMRNLIEDSFPKDTKISCPKGGFILWIEFAKNINSLELFQWALDHKIGIVPGPAYSPSGKYLNCIRMSCGTPLNSEMREGIRILGSKICKISQSSHPEDYFTDGSLNICTNVSMRTFS